MSASIFLPQLGLGFWRRYRECLARQKRYLRLISRMGNTDTNACSMLSFSNVIKVPGPPARVINSNRYPVAPRKLTERGCKTRNPNSPVPACFLQGDLLEPSGPLDDTRIVVKTPSTSVQFLIGLQGGRQGDCRGVGSLCPGL